MLFPFEPPTGVAPLDPFPPLRPARHLNLIIYYMIYYYIGKGTNSGNFQVGYAICLWQIKRNMWTKPEINVNRPKFSAISSFSNVYILTPPLANQHFLFTLQLRITKLRNRPTGKKSTEIIGDVKKSIVWDSGEIISLTVETDRSPPCYTIYYN